MRFWDSSALVPLVCAEAESARCRALLQSDAQIHVWFLTSVEIASALTRKRREGTLSEEQRHVARDRLQALETAWTEMDPAAAVRARARRLLEVHVLRAADALQLAAALALCEERTDGAEFVTLDTELREAAAREGFSVLP
jgi:predicted nucleic acid-binding protein